MRISHDGGERQLRRIIRGILDERHHVIDLLERFAVERTFRSDAVGANLAQVGNRMTEPDQRHLVSTQVVDRIEIGR